MSDCEFCGEGYDDPRYVCEVRLPATGEVRTACIPCVPRAQADGWEKE